MVRNKLRPSESGEVGAWGGRREGRGPCWRSNQAGQAAVPRRGTQVQGELARPGPLSQPHVYSSLPIDDALLWPNGLSRASSCLSNPARFSVLLFLAVRRDIFFPFPTRRQHASTPVAGKTQLLNRRSSELLPSTPPVDCPELHHLHGRTASDLVLAWLAADELSGRPPPPTSTTTRQIPIRPADLGTLPCQLSAFL